MLQHNCTVAVVDIAARHSRRSGGNKLAPCPNRAELRVHDANIGGRVSEQRDDRGRCRVRRGGRFDGEGGPTASLARGMHTEQVIAVCTQSR